MGEEVRLLVPRRLSGPVPSVRRLCEHVFVRWDWQTVENDEQARLPGYARTAVVRRFDAPEALDTRFYEVRAKSALNRIPPSSRVPFPWTVNPYRGCSHACTYCLMGDTPVLLADGRTRAIEELRVGDEIIGTERAGLIAGTCARVCSTNGQTIKPAWAVKLEDGTRLLTSGDHRFLTERGWKHVINTSRSEPRSPALTTNNALLGTGASPIHRASRRTYKRGYLCGSIRGDGLLRLEYPVPAAAAPTTSGWPLPTSRRFVARSVYLERFGVQPNESDLRRGCRLLPRDACDLARARGRRSRRSPS